MVGSAILNKHLSWNNLTNHRALLAQPVSKSIFQNHKLEVLGLIEYGLRLESLIRTLLTLWKGCENVANEDHSLYSQVPNKRVYLLNYCNVELLALVETRS